MQAFNIHTIDSAPEKSQQPLRGLKQNFGIIPNVAATMAESPPLLGAFVGAFVNFHGGSFTEAEKQTLLLANAVTLACPWTVAFHSTLAIKEGLPEGDVSAIRAGRVPADRRYAALAEMTRALLETRGNVSADLCERFAAAGYSQAQMLEVIAGIGISTMAATTGNLAGTPVEEPFTAQAWTPA
jgi:alkylhydroperoxidase family enzyme